MKEQRVSKYCSIHGWCSHSTDECFSQQRKVPTTSRSTRTKQDKQDRIIQEAHAILHHFINKQKYKTDRNDSRSKSKNDLEIKNFEQLSISESDGDDTSIVKAENGDNNESDVDNDIASVSSSSSGQETDVWKNSLKNHVNIVYNTSRNVKIVHTKNISSSNNYSSLSSIDNKLSNILHDKLPSKLSNNLSCKKLEQDLCSNSKISKLPSTKLGNKLYCDKIQSKTPIKIWHNQTVFSSKLYSKKLTSNNALYQFEKETSFENNEISDKSENKMYISFENNAISDKSENKMYSSLDENVNDSIFT